MTVRALITCPQLLRKIDEHRRAFEERGIALVLPDVVQQLTEDELIALLPDISGIIVGDDPLTARVLSFATELRVISKWGVGIDNIDVAAAGELGIAVENTPGVFGDEVADVVLGYLVLMARQLHRIDAAVRSGSWLKPEGVSLRGRTLGVVGLGDIGMAVVRRGLALQMRVLGVEVDRERARAAEQVGVEVVPLEELLRRSDAVSLNCPLTPDNRHMIDVAAIGSMPRGAWIINTSRGALVDEAALVDALRDGQIGAAALDVFEIEPLPPDSPLRDMENVILGAHNSSNTAEAVRRTSALAIANLLEHLPASSDDG